MKSLYYIVFTLSFLVIQNVCISCEKMIEVDMPGNQIGSDQVFEDVQTANVALAGLYASMFKDSVISGSKLGSFLGSYTDDLDGYWVGGSNGSMDIYHNQQQAINTEILAIWATAYQEIYMANVIINGVDKSTTIAVADKNRIIGEALLIRSIIYFYLQQLFGDIPFTITTDYEVNQRIGKTPAPEVFNKLELDLTSAISLLENEYRSSSRIFVNRKIAELMLAKVLMGKKQWDKAEILLKGIVQSPLYQFQNDITKVFNRDSTHILWQLKPANPNDPTQEASYYYFENSIPKSYALTESLVNSFEINDLRKQNWMTPVVNGGKTYYRYEKYKNKTTGSNNSEYSVVFRLEEVYLLLAETLTQQEKTLEALPYINATRVRAGLVALPSVIGKADCLNEILQEDRREFFAEMGHRFLDLKRMERLSVLTSVKPNWKNYHSLWPIPQNELLMNANLAPQNTGY